MEYLQIKAIDAHAYLDESRLSAHDLAHLAFENNLSKIIVSPACTISHEPDKHPAMYWFQRQILKVGFLISFARLISSSFYDKKGELRVFWRKFTREGRALKKVIHPDNTSLAEKISPYDEVLQMWYWINPQDDIPVDEIKAVFNNKQIFGLKIHAYWHGVDLGRIDKYMQLCQDLSCPLYLILGYGNSGDIRPLLNRHKGVKIIIGYGGFPIFKKVWKEISAHENFFVDLASFHLDRSLIKNLLKTLGSNRCIYGTDCPYNFSDVSGRFSYKKTRERLAYGFLTQDDYNKIFFQNIEKLSRDIIT